jgi:PAS domain S-box-containing protein
MLIRQWIAGSAKKPWTADLFAAAATSATLGLRLALRDELRDRPTLIVFAVPIMLSAYVGGRRAGLLATALSYAGASYFLIPPFRSFHVTFAVDRWNLFFLVLSGVAISVLNEALHRARRQAAVATIDLQVRVALVKAEALQTAIFNSVNFSSIATDEKGVIQIFNVGAERMLGYTAAEVVNKLNPADISDPQEMIARSLALSAEMGTAIAPGLETLVYKASRGIEYIYEPTFIRKDGSRFPAVVSVAALRDAQETIIGYLLIGTDNTARKQAEQALLKAGALQRAIFDSANFSSIATDAKGVIQIFNVGAERMLGYTAAEVMNKITPADISDPQEVIARAQALTLELGTSITPGFEALVFKASRGIEDIYELTYVRKDGSRFPAVVSVTALRDASDTIIGYLLIGTDNTARKQAEEARLASEASCRTLFEYAPDGIVIADASGNYLDANPSICKLLGYTREELIGKNASDMVSPVEIPFIGQAVGVIHSKSAYEREWRFRRKDGSLVSAEVLATLMPDGTLMGVIRDITARKAAEEAKQELEAEFRTLIEAMPQMVWTTRPDGWNTYFSQRWMDYTGMTLEESLGHGWNTPFHPEDRQRAWDAWQQAITGSAVYSVECRLRSADGAYRWWWILGAPLRGADGAILKWFGTCTDITERKLAAEKIRTLNADLEQRVVERTAELQTANEKLFASQEGYRSLVQTAREYAILLLDTEGYVTTWNEGAERIKGYTEAEIIGQHFARFYTAGDVQNGKPPFELKQALAMGQYEDNGWRVRRDGTLYWANVVITAVRDSHGVHTGFSKIVRDLSLRRQAEEKLRTSEEWLRALVEGGKKYAIITLDPQGRVTTWNAGAQRIKGYEADEVIGQSISRFYTPEDVQRGKPEQQLKTATETGQFEEDGWRVRKDGSRFWANVLISSLRNSDGKHLGFSKITRDLTDIMKAEEQARNFFILSLELLCIAGVDGYFKVLNPAWENTLGYTQAELCAKPFWEMIHPDDLLVTQAAAKRITTAQPLNHFENRYRCKDGSYRWLLWKVALSTDAQLMHCAATDITQLKQTEGEIAGLNKSLQLQNLELATANKELEAFSYSVSHDLRAPLRSIDGFSKAILEDYTDKLDSTGQDYLQRVRSSSQRMGQLIDDMLNLSRVSRGELLHESTDLSQIACDVISECRAASIARDVQVEITDGLVTEADPRLMRVVLTNLLGNAWKFTSKTEHARIEFGSAGCNGSTEYFVRDNGAGFDMAYAAKLFGAFQRLHTDKEFPGTGIGLATIQRIIHRHGGDVRAKSKPGEGATFYFTLGHHAVVETPVLQSAAHMQRPMEKEALEELH